MALNTNPVDCDGVLLTNAIENTELCNWNVYLKLIRKHWQYQIIQYTSMATQTFVLYVS